MKLTDKQKKCIAVAKDVLKRLSEKKIRPRTANCYVAFSQKTAAALPKEGSLQKALKKVKTCEVCALGSLFISHVGLYNKVDLAGLGLGMLSEPTPYWEPEIVTNVAREDACAPLLEYFDAETLDAIEDAFEETTDRRSATEKLRSIMQNIIDNRGEFVP